MVWQLRIQFWVWHNILYVRIGHFPSMHGRANDLTLLSHHQSSYWCALNVSSLQTRCSAHSAAAADVKWSLFWCSAGQGLNLKSRSWRCELQMHSLLGREKKEEEAGFGIDLGLSVGFLPQAATMFSCVGCFWVLLSSALVAVCSFSFISPAWIVKDQLRNNHHQQHNANNKDSVSFGLLWHCSESLDHMYRCYTFGGLGKFAEIPSSSWQVVHHTHTPMSVSCGWIRACGASRG